MLTGGRAQYMPTEEEAKLLAKYTGPRDKLVRCEQYFLEVLQLPRAEQKLSVCRFKVYFDAHIKELREQLDLVIQSSMEIRSSVLLQKMMQVLLVIVNALRGVERTLAVIGTGGPVK